MASVKIASDKKANRAKKRIAKIATFRENRSRLRFHKVDLPTPLTHLFLLLVRQCTSADESFMFRFQNKISVANSADFSENGRFSIFLADEIFTKICKDFWPKRQIFSFKKNYRFLYKLCKCWQCCKSNKFSLNQLFCSLIILSFFYFDHLLI